MAAIERPNRDALDEAIGIYRDVICRFILGGFERVHGSAAERAIRESLLPSQARDFRRNLEQGDDLASAIDDNFFPRLVRMNWDKVFRFDFKRERAIKHQMELIADARNRCAHRRGRDLDADYTRARLFDIAYVLGCVDASDQKRDVSNITAQLSGPTPLGIGVESTAVPGKLSGPKPKGYTIVPGYVNPKDQKNLGKVVPERQSPANGQYMYRMKCLKCGGEYNCWGGDIHHHKCPYHDGGAPGLDPSEGVIVG